MKSIENFFDDYAAHTAELLAGLDRKAIGAFMTELERTRQSENVIYVAGNGGSASLSSHMTTDFGFTRSDGHGVVRPLRMHPLVDSSVISAAANDFGYDQIFVRQLQTLYRKGDVLVVISASGNSPNVVEAARFVRESGGVVLGLLGFDGGAVKELCHTAVVVRTSKGEYGPVEDIHVILMHAFTEWLKMPSEDGR